MTQGLQTDDGAFIDRRKNDDDHESPDTERRQFADSHDELSPDARELAMAIDAYKLRHRRRFLSYEEILAVVVALGYHR